MPKSMLVALWLRRTGLRRQYEDTDTRLASLTQALAVAEGIRTGYHPAHQWARPQVIFVAPEYLFGEPTGFSGVRPRVLSYTPHPQTSQDRHLDEAEAYRIFGELKSTSNGYPDFVIVPGTIAWYKLFSSLRDPGIAKKLAARIIATRKRLQPELARDDGLSVDKESAFDVVADHPAPSTDDKVAVLRSFKRMAERRGPLTPDEQWRLANARLCLNTAVVLYGGKAPFVYNKQGDFHEVLDQYDAARAYQVAIPGSRDGVFEIKGIKYGIEVCLDHQIGALRNRRRRFWERDPSIHIITSASVEVDTDPANRTVRNHGYVMNASCDPTPGPDGLSGLWYNHPQRGLIKKRPTLTRNNVAGYPLWVYEITLV